MSDISGSLAGVGIALFFIGLFLLFLNVKGHAEMDIDIPLGKTNIKAPIWFVPIGLAFFCWILAAVTVGH